MFNSISTLFKGASKSSQGREDAWYYSALADCADGLWGWNLLTGDLYISFKLRELIGYSEEETKDQPLAWWLERIHPEDQPNIRRKLGELGYSNTQSTYFEGCRFLCKNGDYVWLENHAKILTDQNGKLVRIAAMVINITPQKYIQNQLYAIISDQEKEARNKMRFLSTLSHEFRSPLSGIIGMTSLLKETILSQDQLHFTENISNSTEMLLALVNDILDVTKLNSGKFEFEKIQFSPIQVLKRASDLIRPSILKKNITFNTIVSEDIPEYLMGDPTRLQQILVNLLSNASKFTSMGSITLLVKKSDTSSSQEASPFLNLHFEITDTGIGIASEIQETLFEDFTQANSAITRIYGGTGLGLSICRELVHLMGGQIGVISAPDKGSTFWFTIPFEIQYDLSSIKSPNPTLAQDPAPQSKLRILLVEDNLVNQEVMRGLLTLLGDDVTVANNGEEAVGLFPSKTFDIVLMDLNMPILDGLKATEMIRKLPNGAVPIIAVTANTFSGEQENCLQHGITHVLNKPIDKITLEMALHPYRSQINTQTIIKQEALMPQSTPPLIDQKALQSLINDLGKDKVIKLLNMYRDDASTLMNQIKYSPSSELNMHAHTLAGMSENLGLLLVGKTARDIMGATQTNADNLPALIQNLERHFESSLTEIQGIVHSSEFNS